MVYSYITHYKLENVYIITFNNDIENHQLVIKFLPTFPMVFSKHNINLSQMKLRDPEVLLACLEEYGLTLIIKGLV